MFKPCGSVDDPTPLLSLGALTMGWRSLEIGRCKLQTVNVVKFALMGIK